VLTTSQTLNLTPLLTQTSWMFAFCPDMMSSLGFAFSTIF